MNSRTTPISLIACLLCAISSLVHPLTVQASGTEAEWVFIQKHNLFGNQRIYLTADALKIVNETSGFEILAKAPDWRVYSYRPDEKTVCVQPLNIFLDSHLYGGLTKPIEDQHGLVKGAVREDGALKLITYRSRNGDDLFWFTTNVPVNAKMCQILECYSRFKAVIPQSGLMIRSSASAPRQEKALKAWGTSVITPSGPQDILVTKSWKRTASRPSDFAPPLGFKPISDLSQIAFSKSGRRDAETMFSDLGIGEEAGPKNATQGKQSHQGH